MNFDLLTIQESAVKAIQELLDLAAEYGAAGVECARKEAEYERLKATAYLAHATANEGKKVTVAHFEALVEQDTNAARLDAALADAKRAAIKGKLSALESAISGYQTLLAQIKAEANLVRTTGGDAF